MNKGQLIVFSGPSGVGKGTVLKAYLPGHPDAALSISATTRQPRPGETDGVDYYFLSKEDFVAKAEQGGMLEYACYNGNYYGTPKDKVEEALAQGRDVILEIETQGAFKVKEQCPEALLIFVLPPSWETLCQRLSGRGTEDAATVQKRLAIAAGELKQAPRYDFLLVNDQVEEAAKRLEQVIEAGRCRPASQQDLLNNLMEEVDHYDA